VEHLRGVAEGNVNRLQGGLRAVAGASRRLHEEVQQRGVLSAPRDEHVATRAEPRQKRLGGKRRQHRRHRGVDRVAAFSQHACAGLRGQRVSGGNHSSVTRSHARAIAQAPRPAREAPTRAPGLARGRSGWLLLSGWG
jgi:hypothetical protein